MDLNCLSCGGSFTLDDSRVGPEGGAIACPMCGRQQHFTRSQLAQPAAAARQAEGGSPQSGTIRRPMQAFSSFMSRPSPAPEPPPPTSGKRISGEADVIAPPPAARAEAVMAAAAAGMPEGSGAWLVRSPTGLVLEFPSSNLLINWSAVVDNPAPYMVSRGGDDWTSLDTFVREVKLGSRATQVFQRMTGGGPMIRPSVSAGDALDAADASGSAAPASAPAQERADTGQKSVQPAAPGRIVSSAAQFQFKLAPERKSAWPRVLLVVGITVVVLAGAAAAVWFSGILQ